MIDSLDTLAAAALSNAFVATLFAVPAFFASRWARPTIAHALWLLVLVKLVTPPLFVTRVTLPAAMTVGGTSPTASDLDVTSAAAEVHAIVDSPASDVQRPREVPATTPLPEGFEETSPREPISDQAASNIDSPPTLDSFVVEAIENDAQLVDAPPHRAADMPMPARAPALEEPGSWDAAPTEGGFVREPIIPSIDRDNNAADLVATTNANTDDAPLSTSTSIGTPSEVLATYATDPATSASSILLAVWAAGAIGWCLLAITRIVRFRRALGHASLATPPLQAEVAALAAQIELRRVPEILVVPGQISPLVCTPLGRAVLILPRDLLARFTDEQRAAVIAHELAHLRRRDHWTRWLELVAIALYWWLPTVWIARRLLHQAEEACCDAWVVWLLPQRSRDYARALLETIDFLTAAPDAPLLSSGFGRASTLKRRFDMILRQHASHRLSWPARIGIAVAGLMVLPWSLTTLAADDPTTPAPPAPTAANAGNPSSAGTPAGGLPSTATPPRAENGAPELPPVAPLTDAPRADATPPAGVPSLPPSASNAAPLTPPLPSAQATAPAALPTPSVGAPPTVEPPSSRPALVPPTPTDPSPYRSGAGTPPTAEPLGPAATTPIPGATPVVPRSERGAGDPRVLARLERLEATTAELLMLVKQLRDERQPGPKSYRGVKDVPAKEYTVPSQFGMRYGHGDRQLLIEVAGREVSAIDVATGKVMWTTAMPWNVNAVQGANNNLVASGFNGGQAVIDPNNGSIKVTNVPAIGTYGGGESRPAKVTSPVDPTAAARDDAKAAEIAAKRAQEVANIEMDMLAVERKLAQERAELQHRIRQMETRRARLARKLDSLPPNTNSDEWSKLAAALEEAEDQLASTEHEADVFEADLEFKVREIQLKRDQLLRSQGFDPRESTPTSKQPKRAAVGLQQQ